jgi:hypothetical protein
MAVHEITSILQYVYQKIYKSNRTKIAQQKSIEALLLCVSIDFVNTHSRCHQDND